MSADLEAAQAVELALVPYTLDSVLKMIRENYDSDEVRLFFDLPPKGPGGPEK